MHKMGQDKYTSFRDLQAGEKRGEDYDFESRQHQGASAVIIAPHGGTIEPFTDKIADEIAGNDFSFYRFVALKPDSGLHIKSHLFDEPTCVGLVTAHQYVVSVHGWGEDGERVCLGGRDSELIRALTTCLVASGINVEAASGELSGSNPMNITNRGKSGRGLQCELTMKLRRNGALVQKFADAVRSVLVAASGNLNVANQAEPRNNFVRLREHLKEKSLAEKLVVAYCNPGATKPHEAMKTVLKNRLEQLKSDIGDSKT
jgi:phage replication-related protein YjqB (UPF0714/DUF867 family)